MATIVQLNKWDGGSCEDLRTFATDQSEYSKNFDIFSNPHYLQPYPDTAIQTITSGNALETYVISDVIEDPTYGFVGLGQVSVADSKIKFLSKDATTTATWTQRAESATYLAVTNTLVIYKGLSYAMGYIGADGQLLEFTNATTITAKGTITGKTATCRPFVHPEDNILYMGSGYVISRYDGSTLTSHTTLIPTSMVIVSLTNYGGYLVIGCRESNTGKSVVYLWGRDMTLNTLQRTIDVGSEYLHGAFNIQDTIVMIMTTNASSLFIHPKLFVKVYEGNTVRTVKEIDRVLTIAFKFALGKDKIIFASLSDDSAYVVTKNKDGYWTVSRNRYLFNGATIGTVLRSIALTSEIFWVAFSSTTPTAGLLYCTSPSTDYTGTCLYRTTINPNLPVMDRDAHKQLDALEVSFTGTTTGTIQVKYSVDGSAMSALIPTGTGGVDTTAIEDVRYITNEDDGTPLLTGREFQFQIETTGNVKVKSLKYKYTKLNSLI